MTFVHYFLKLRADIYPKLYYSTSTIAYLKLTTSQVHKYTPYFIVVITTNL